MISGVCIDKFLNAGVKIRLSSERSRRLQKEKKIDELILIICSKMKICHQCFKRVVGAGTREKYGGIVGSFRIESGFLFFGCSFNLLSCSLALSLSFTGNVWGILIFGDLHTSFASHSHFVFVDYPPTKLNDRYLQLQFSRSTSPFSLS